MNEAQFDIGMIGIGTMGRALLENMVDHGFTVAGYSTDSAQALALSDSHPEGKAKGFPDVAEFVGALKKPRAIILLIPAGDPVDETIEKLKPLLDEGDFVIDAGNSYYKDTDRREANLAGHGFGFMGMGVSGGEEGARHGPSMMPGGTEAQYDRVKPIFEAVSAKYEGVPCVALMGKGSAGHYVKTVHNGIEYGIMQLLAECYDLMTRVLEMSAPEIGDFFAKLNQSECGGFLVEIAGIVLHKKDEKDPSQYLVDLISDKAKQKGTGKWTSQDAMDLGIPIPSIDASVAARELSGLKDLRVAAQSLLQEGSVEVRLEKQDILNLFQKALHVAMLITYAQGFELLHAADQEYQYGVDLQTVAKIWRNGCIIRSKLLEPIRGAFERKPNLQNLLLDKEISEMVRNEAGELRALVGAMIRVRIPAPSLSACLAYLDGYASARLPANLIQAQRDFFGAHTYERLDIPGSFHTKWN